nr:hypothetical protein [Tanacetum cinerariifolium]
MATKGYLREVVTTCERSWVQASSWGFPSGAKKEWGLFPKAKVQVLDTAQLDVTCNCHLSLTGSFFFFSSIAVQTSGSGISNLLAVATTFTGSGNLYCQWEHLTWQWECLVHFIPNIDKSGFLLTFRSFAIMTGHFSLSPRNAYSRWGGNSLSSTSGGSSLED